MSHFILFLAIFAVNTSIQSQSNLLIAACTGYFPSSVRPSVLEPCYHFLPNIPSGTLSDNTLDTAGLLLPSYFSNQQLFNYVPLVGGCRQCRRPPGAFSPSQSLPSVS